MVANVLVAVIAIVMTVQFAPLRLLYLDFVFRVDCVFDSLHLWTVIANDVVICLIDLALQL